MLSIWMIGDLPTAALAADKALAITRAADTAAAIDLLARRQAPPPELLLVAEARGGEIPAETLETLRRHAPLARIWRVAGSWCEGERRSGRPPEGCLTSYWHQWEARFARGAACALRGEVPAWSLATTLSADERLLADVAGRARRLSTPPGRAALVICAASAAAAGALADVCRPGGYEPVIVAEDAAFRIGGAAALVWDTFAPHLGDRARVGRLRACVSGAPVVAVVGFPRADDVRGALEAGVGAVVSKPFLVADLLWHIERLTEAA